jgi:hypothetical protein
MKSEKIILENIKNNKDLQKKIKTLYHFTNEDFYNHALRYLKASKENRIMCVIDKVSASGMSRTIKFLEASFKKRNIYGMYIYNFYALFICLGHQKCGNSDYFRIHGTGMDMVFHTHYCIIHDLYRLGFITKKECDKLAQKTPHKL